jgi:hypothetical protein
VTSPKTRRRRNKTPRRPFNGSPADHAPTEQWLTSLRTGPGDGATYAFGGASDAGLNPGSIYPAPAAPPLRTRHADVGGGWTMTMTVNTDRPASAWNARLRAAYTSLKLKWAYLEQRGMGYRIDEADQVMQRGEELPPGSVIAETHREAVTHLVGDWGEWAPAGGWDHGWAAGLPWYRPEDGDLGLPLRRDVTS